MVPGDPAEQGDVGLVQVELRAQVDRRGEVFIALDDHHGRFVREPDHHIETFKLGADHVVAVHPGLLQHMEDHGRDGGFAVAPADHDAFLVFRLFV